MKIKWVFISLAILLFACNLGPLLVEPTPTPVDTATSTPTPAPTSTETPTASQTASPFPTPTFTPTPVTCPKGTVLEPSVNRCYFATRTPKAEDTYCGHFTHKWACINNGCAWNGSTKICS